VTEYKPPVNVDLSFLKDRPPSDWEPVRREDRRDQRDPETIGKEILRRRKRSKAPASVLADRFLG
jgi:hypothetical protein